ncbi:unnamed protein product [Brassica rapa]|uniref:Uncharacterized protein n=2 Tax=Brassica campestris TaxID=3711 RepID=A0A8D9GL60_BRACM|nr:unnamed protein product [Brassica rapa]
MSNRSLQNFQLFLLNNPIKRSVTKILKSHAILRYTALVEKNAFQAEKDLQKVMSIYKVSQVAEDSSSETPHPPPSTSSYSSYSLFSRRFFSLHGRDLFAASANWFLVDVVFYTSNLLLSQIVNLSDKPANMTNVYDSAFEAGQAAKVAATDSPFISSIESVESRFRCSSWPLST